MNFLEETFRWYGPDDPVSLQDIRQAGATGIVSALHDRYDGSAWPIDAIKERRRIIEDAGLRWSVVESIPVNDAIKRATPERDGYIERYIETMRNLSKAGLEIICYNFMPVVDWTRTDLRYPLPNGALALRYDAVDFAAYDLFVLQRPDVEKSYDEAQIAAASKRHQELSEEQYAQIERNLIAGLPATERQFDRASFLEALAQYREIDHDQLHENLAYFLRAIIPVAQECGLRMCIHPDDPSFSLYGLPRIVSTADDIRRIFAAVDTPENGLTYCAGSFGSRRENNLQDMAREFAHRTHFIHLRSVEVEADGSFYEADHMAGNANIPALIEIFLEEQTKRKAAGRADWQLPMRPDHGHLLTDDINKTRINPGYSLIGRLKGLAEIRGVMFGLNLAQEGAR